MGVCICVLPVSAEQPRPGEWVQPVKTGYLMECCDCGLVHRIDFRVVKRHGDQSTVQSSRYLVQLRAYRNE